MSGFTTEALLYPLAKGDIRGHAFHGNQYEVVASEGQSESRPPTGQFQLSGSEIREWVKSFREERHVAGILTQEAILDSGAVALSKMLGFDKPAQQPKTPPSREPNLYRGCSPEGAESLLRPLEHYGSGGGAAYGNGVYSAENRLVAEQYNVGAMVKIWLDPDTTIADGEDVEKAYRAFDVILPNEFSSFAYQPVNAALLFGYQAIEWGGTFVILDRSKMTISTES